MGETEKNRRGVQVTLGVRETARKLSVREACLGVMTWESVQRSPAFRLLGPEQKYCTREPWLEAEMGRACYEWKIMFNNGAY